MHFAHRRHSLRVMAAITAWEVERGDLLCALSTVPIVLLVEPIQEWEQIRRIAAKTMVFLLVERK